MSREYKDRKGVTPVHLFKENWCVGRLIQKKDEEVHCVIYGPDRAEHRVYGDDALRIYDRINPIEYYRHRPETVDRQYLKLYILTSILDDKEQWVFDMKTSPEDGPVKMIYPGPTIKWTEWKGNWESVTLVEDDQKSIINPDSQPGADDFWMWVPCKKYIKPIAWKKQD